MTEKPDTPQAKKGQKMDKIDYDKWINRGGGATAIGILVVVMLAIRSDFSEFKKDITQDVRDMKTKFVEVTTELRIVSPKQINESVIELQKSMLTKEEISAIVQTNAPWAKERDEIIAKISRLEFIVEQMQQQQKKPQP